jgi:hypothetical protein
VTIHRLRVTWNNFPGAPGYSNFYTRDADIQSLATAVRAMFEANKGLFPSGMTWTYPSVMDAIDELTGTITGSDPITPPAGNASTGSGVYAGSAGAVVNWLTDTFVNGRRVRGRTFLVPLAGAQFDTNGSLATSAVSTLQTSAAGLVTAQSGKMCVWHRPTTFAAGSAPFVTGSNVPDLAAVLRSRRV